MNAYFSCSRVSVSVWMCACVLSEFPFLVFSCVVLCKNVVFLAAHAYTYLVSSVPVTHRLPLCTSSDASKTSFFIFCMCIWCGFSTPPLARHFPLVSAYSLLLLLPYLSHIALPLANTLHITAHSTWRFLYSF